MADLQKDAVYKSLLRSLTVYVGKVSDMYNNPENFSENSAEYQDLLIDLYPAMENLCQELNSFYGAEIRIPKIDAASTIEQADYVAQLVADAKREFKTNPELSDARIIFSLKSDAVEQQLHFMHEYIGTLGNSDAKIKAGYWFYHNIQALYGYWQVLSEKHDERLWDKLCESNIAETIATQHKNDNYKKDSGLDWTDVLLNSFYNAGLDYLDSGAGKKDFDLHREVLNVLEKEYGVNVSDIDLQRLLKANQKAIKSVLSQFENEHALLSRIGDILDEFEENSDFYENERIKKLISSTRGNDYFVSLTDEDVQTFIIEYPNISELADKELKEYLQYQGNKEIMKNYEQSHVDDELKFAFVLKLKEWMVQTAKNAPKVIQPLSDLSAGRNRFSDPKERSRFIDEALELALDAALISEGVFDYVPSSKNGNTGVMLNLSVIGEEYIKKLIERKDQLTNKDFKRLYIFLNEFQSNYELNRPELGFTQEEARLLKKFNLTAYAECLDQQPDCFDKLNISRYSVRLLGAASRGRMGKLHNQQEEFIRSSACMYQEEKAVLEDYLQCGNKLNPQLDVEKSISLADSVVMPLVVMPIYNQGHYSEENYLQGMDYAVAQRDIDSSAKSFVKSAINGYKKMIDKKCLDMPVENQSSYLRYIARGYFRNLDKLQEIDNAKNTIQKIHERQENIFNRWQEFDEYKNKKHPSKNNVTKLLIKSKSRGGK